METIFIIMGDPRVFKPDPAAVAEFFREWISRYNFAITIDDGPVWVDSHTMKRVHKNQVVCMMKNDFLVTFPNVANALARKIAEKSAKKIEESMVSKIMDGQGSDIDISDLYL